MKKTVLFFLLWLNLYIYFLVADRDVDHINTCCGDNAEWIEVIRRPLGFRDYAAITGVIFFDVFVVWLLCRSRRLRRKALIVR